MAIQDVPDAVPNGTSITASGTTTIQEYLLPKFACTGGVCIRNGVEELSIDEHRSRRATAKLGARTCHMPINDPYKMFVACALSVLLSCLIVYALL